jgi:hypothetical protein
MFAIVSNMRDSELLRRREILLGFERRMLDCDRYLRVALALARIAAAM